MTLKETAYAKLNLALHVRGKLNDGRHRIETVFAFCGDGDALTFERPPHTLCEIDVFGPFGPEVGNGNLVKVAWREMCRAAHIEGGACFSLDKRLPVASGLGGGSADSAAALRLITSAYRLRPEIARQVAPKIGADVPSCLLSRTCRGDGAGDDIRPLELPGLSGMPVLVVNPRVPLPTAAVFARWDRIDRGPLDDWRYGRNDLETAAIELVPQISAVLAWLATQPGAETVRMSGSGPTCFALFESEALRDRATQAVPREWWHLATYLR